MEQMERLLYRYGSLKNSIRECRADIRELYAEKYSCVDDMLRPSMSAGGKRKEQNVHSDPVYKIVQRMVDVYDVRIAKATEHLKKLYAEFDEMKRKIHSAGLSEDEREYVELRYVKGVGVREIVRRMCYSERQTQRLRRNVLRAMGEVVG